MATMSASPSAVVLGNKMYCFFQGGNDSGELWYAVCNGQYWENKQQVPGTTLSAGPSAVVFDKKSIVFTKAAVIMASSGIMFLMGTSGKAISKSLEQAYQPGHQPSFSTTKSIASTKAAVIVAVFGIMF